MKNVPLDIENHIISYLYKPLQHNRKRCYAFTKNNKVCKNNCSKNNIFCFHHNIKFQEAIESSNKFSSICTKSLFLRRIGKK